MQLKKGAGIALLQLDEKIKNGKQHALSFQNTIFHSLTSINLIMESIPFK